MNEFLHILLLAAIPAGAIFLGGLAAELVDVSRRTLSLALHAVAGMLFGVIGVEVMPRALEISHPWITVLAFSLGGLFFIGVDWLSNLTRQLMDMEMTGTTVGILAGVGLDVLTDGLMIASGSALGGNLGILLAVSLALADLPEGFATLATLKVQKTRRLTRILLALGLAVLVPVGAVLGYWLLRDQSETVNLAVLAFTGGLLLVLLVEEMVPEAHRARDAHLATVLLVGGFAFFALLSIYVG